MQFKVLLYDEDSEINKANEELFINFFPQKKMQK